MNASQCEQPLNEDHKQQETLTDQTTTPAEKGGKHSKSMHDRVAVWCDCCSCEAVPYWVNIAEEIGTSISIEHKKMQGWKNDAEINHGNKISPAGIDKLDISCG